MKDGNVILTGGNMDKEEIRQMSARLNEIVINVYDASDDHVRIAVEDIAVYMISMNERLEELEARKRISDGLEEAVNNMAMFDSGHTVGHSKGYDEGFNDGFVAGSGSRTRAHRTTGD